MIKIFYLKKSHFQLFFVPCFEACNGSRFGQQFVLIFKDNMCAKQKLSTNSPPAPCVFSRRQADIIRHWGRSFDPQQVAHELDIKVSTVQTHLSRMRKKLGVKRTVEVWEYWSKR
jgi:DNA-binding CsgD family transcriptional regulator